MEKVKLDDDYYDNLLQILCDASETQIDTDIRSNIKKFMNEQHTLREKYDFIESISKKPLNTSTNNIGSGRISHFVRAACDLERYYERPE